MKHIVFSSPKLGVKNPLGCYLIYNGVEMSLCKHHTCLWLDNMTLEMSRIWSCELLAQQCVHFRPGRIHLV